MLPYLVTPQKPLKTIVDYDFVGWFVCFEFKSSSRWVFFFFFTNPLNALRIFLSTEYQKAYVYEKSKFEP